MKLGIIGYPLSHSFSPSYFSNKFQKEQLSGFSYNAFPISDITEVRELMIREDLLGINVTIPHKESIIPYLDGLGPVAEAIGAVNTVLRKGEKLYGYNTDVHGFKQSLLELIGEQNLNASLILGTGGSSKAVAHTLESMGLKYSFISRSGIFPTYDDMNIRIIQDHQLIINTTPLGMFPKVNSCPAIPYNYLTKEHFCFDLVYNPEKTLFLKKAERQGAKIKNGYKMLVLQAEKSWQIWNQT